ncbi:MAG: hypothetical protein R2701_07690 [Acidimicrobiales bacterium]
MVLAIGIPVVLASLDRTTPAADPWSSDVEPDADAVDAVALFDPDGPLDLSGLPTVSPQQQAAAEDLVRSVLDARADLPTFEEAPALGYVSIGDSFTGEEHPPGLAGRAGSGDPRPRPSRRARLRCGKRRRAHARGGHVRPTSRGALDDAPTLGGDLTRWHLHGDLCLDPQRTPPAITASTDAAGRCPDGLEEQQPMPTLHVWVVAHPCGPFSELEGVGTDPSAVAGGCQHHH